MYCTFEKGFIEVLDKHASKNEENPHVNIDKDVKN